MKFPRILTCLIEISCPIFSKIRILALFYCKQYFPEDWDERNCFQVLFGFCSFKGCFFFIVLEQLFNKSPPPFFLFLSFSLSFLDKVTAVDLVCLTGSEKMKSNKVSISSIRIIHLTTCIDLSWFLQKKKKKEWQKEVVFAAALSWFVFIHLSITECLKILLVFSQKIWQGTMNISQGHLL